MHMDSMHWQDLQDQMQQNAFLNGILTGASDYSKGNVS